MNPDADVEKLIVALDSDDWSTRWNAVRELGELKAVQAVTKLSSCLDDPDADIHIAAEEALLKIASPQALDSIAKHSKKLDEEDRAVLLDRSQPLDARLTSLEVLWKRKPEHLESMLENCVDDPDKRLQRKVFKYLSILATTNHIPILIKKLSHSDDDIKDLAVNTLYKFRNQLDAQLLFPLLDEQNISLTFFTKLANLLTDLKDKKLKETAFEKISGKMKQEIRNYLRWLSQGLTGRIPDSWDSLIGVLKSIDQEKASKFITEIKDEEASKVKQPVCERCHKPLKLEDPDQFKIQHRMPSSYLGTICTNCRKVECYKCRGGIGLPCSWCGGDVDGAFVHHFRRSTLLGEWAARRTLIRPPRVNR